MVFLKGTVCSASVRGPLPKVSSAGQKWEQGQEAFLSPVLGPHKRQPTHTEAWRGWLGSGQGQSSDCLVGRHNGTPDAWETRSSHIRWGSCAVSQAFHPDNRSLWKKWEILKLLLCTERGRKKKEVFFFFFVFFFFSPAQGEWMNSTAVFFYRSGWHRVQI